MIRILINSSYGDEHRVALVDGAKLYDFDTESPEKILSKGSIFKATVSRIESSLDAAFVNFGSERHGFLPLKDLSSEYYKKDKKKLSKEIREAIERGLKYSAYDYANAIDFMKQSYESYKEVFEDYHGIITPASNGVADKGLKSTGSADFQKIWTYLGLPAISLPLLSGENDLPLGVQLVGDRFDDLRFLGTANWLEKNCKDE